MIETGFPVNMNFLVFFTACHGNECSHRRVFNDGYHIPFELAITDHQGIGLAAKNNFTTRLTDDRDYFRGITLVGFSPRESRISAIAILGKLSVLSECCAL